MTSVIRSTRGSALRTHEGAPASRISPEQQLRRSVMACLLWEETFYEAGKTISDRIRSLVGEVPADKVIDIMIEARHAMNLRHVPLLLACELARLGGLNGRADSINRIILRADELAELVAMWWKVGGRKNLPKPLKKGLALAFGTFDDYQLAKYDRDHKDVRLRDVAFLCHVAACSDGTRGQRIARLVNKSYFPEKTRSGFKVKEAYGLGDYHALPAPDIWEVGLSAGQDKKQTWERLLREDKLGGLALLRNLRNMISVGVDADLIRSALGQMSTDRILPFRFIAAARYAPQFEKEIEAALFRCLAGVEQLPGRSVVVVDCSASMDDKLSAKSEMTRFDVAAAVAMMCRELSDEVRVFAYGTVTVEVPARQGFALRDALRNARVGSATNLGDCVRTVRKTVPVFDRLIVVTDEQSHDDVPAPHTDSEVRGYIVNVACYQNGIGYDRWVKIDGFSEAVLRYIAAYEQAL